MSEDFAKKFLEESQQSKLGVTHQKQGIPLPPYEEPVPADARLIPLPRPETIQLPPADLRQVMEQRTTLRKYQETPLTLEELAYLLWLTQGIKEVIPAKLTRRTVPSAGSRHPFETYLLINRVNELEAGLYRYVASQHAIYKLAGAEKTEEITAACGKQAHVHNSAVTFLWVAVPERTAWRYGERAFRYIFLDAGHVCQNLYLAAESIGCGVCAIAAYDDDLLNAALGVDGETQLVLYVGTVGKR
ncbi:MAG TPA: SagB/ThcOx family dehydrogenase [Longilinea sp.]|nr:SagB/ThcOx family dehydrogenase [Longilinea sp.]